MNYIEIAEVVFFTNVPQGYWPSDSEAESVATQVLTEFEARLRESPLADEVEVVRVEYQIGCIITTLTLGVAAGGAVAGGILAFGKKYPEIRKGLILFLRDLHGFWTHLKDPDKKVTTWLYSDEVFTSGKIEAKAKEVAEGRAKLTALDKKPKQSTRTRKHEVEGPSL